MKTIRFSNYLGGDIWVWGPLARFLIRVFGVWHLGARIRLHILTQTLKNLKLSGKALDAGCGYGFNTEVLSKSGFSTTGVDLDPEKLKVAKKLFKDAVFLREDICKLPFGDNTFDLVICFEVLEHLWNDRKALKEISRVTKRGGYLIATFPEFEESLKDYDKLAHTHVRPGYKISEFSSIASEAGFVLAKNQYYCRGTIGNFVFYLDFWLSRKSMVLAMMAFPILYPLVLFNYYLGPAKGANIVVVLKKDDPKEH